MRWGSPCDHAVRGNLKGTDPSRGSQGTGPMEHVGARGDRPSEGASAGAILREIGTAGDRPLGKR